MSGRAFQKYNRYHEWWSKSEKNIKRFTIVLFLVLYASQSVNFVMEQRGVKLLTSKVEQMEGQAVADSQTKINTGTIELTVVSNSDYENIDIYINGEHHKTFDKKSVSLTVKNNDIIEISGIKNQYPANIKVTSVSRNIEVPEQNKIIRVNGNFVSAGRIRLK